MNKINFTVDKKSDPFFSDNDINLGKKTTMVDSSILTRHFTIPHESC